MQEESKMVQIEIVPNKPPSSFAWLTVGVLIFSLLIEQLVSISGWILTVLVITLNSLALSADSWVLKRSGLKAPTAWIILVPVYLWQRANLVKDKTRSYFWAWTVVFLLLIGVGVYKPPQTASPSFPQAEESLTKYHSASGLSSVGQQDWARPTVSQAQLFYNLGREIAEIWSSSPEWQEVALTEMGKVMLAVIRYWFWYVTENGWLYQDIGSMDTSVKALSWLAFLTPCAHIFALGVEEYFAGQPPLTPDQIDERLKEVTNKVDLAFFRVTENPGESWDITWNVTVLQRGIVLGRVH